MPGRTRTEVGKVGPWTFFEIRHHGFKGDLSGKPLYEFEVNGHQENGAEWYESLDMAIVSAVGEKWTGRRGAGGTGVDTAAGWFMRMIGAVR
jgi:hypothetical protein